MCVDLDVEPRITAEDLIVYKICRRTLRSKDPKTTFKSRYEPGERDRQDDFGLGVCTVYRLGRITTKSKLGYYCYKRGLEGVYTPFFSHHSEALLECLVPAGTVVREASYPIYPVILAQRLIPLRVVKG